LLDDNDELHRLRGENQAQAALIEWQKGEIDRIELRAEEQLQKADAFWIAKTSQLSSTLRARDKAIAELSQQCDEERLSAERRLQAVGAFWIDKLQTERSQWADIQEQ